MKAIGSTIASELTEALEHAFSTAFPGENPPAKLLQAVPSANESFGDYQCNAAMGLAKHLKQPPRAIAEKLAGAIESDWIERVEIAGPGFLNIHVKTAALAARLEAVQQDERLGVAQSGDSKRMILDYSSPNVAKPMHIGHIRSTVIGDALKRLHRFLGWDVIADNHLGDWGTQFGLLIAGYREFGDPAALEKNPIEELERIYRTSYERSQADEAWLQHARAELVKLQQGDADNKALWQEFVELSKQEFKKIYDRLDVSFDMERGESYYHDKLADVIAALEAKGLVEESEGALVVQFEEEKLPLSIVRKSDGAFNYTTTDVATVRQRVEEFKPDVIVYVTDERQQLHFRQLFAICEKLGMDQDLQHIWFGLMRLPEGAFSTRQGNVIKLELLLDEAERRALELVQRSSSAMPEEQQRDVARAVGIGAVKYADLSQNAQSMVTFTWEKALSMEGNSAPYLQYAHARIASVIDKYKERFPDQNINEYPLKLEEPIERKLALHVLRFGEALQDAARGYKPHLLADYLYQLAQVYSTFYQTVPFLKADEGVRESRVRLCDLVAKTLRLGLSLMGIQTPDRI